MSNATTYRNFTLGEITVSFVPFALALSAALLGGELVMDMGMGRTVYTIWATAALVAPAICAFTLPSDSSRKHHIWILFWTFSLVTYLVHAYYAVVWVYHASMQEFLAGQGKFPALINVIFTAWWILDVALAWFSTSGAKWIRVQRIWAHWFIGLTFVTSTVFLKHGYVNVIGALLTISLVYCLAKRIDAMRIRATIPTPAPSPA